MLDKNNKRMLAYTIRVGHIDEIPGADNIALAHANAWPVIVKKTEFKEGDLAVFFEIDSKLPEEDERYAFLAAKHFKIKTMKLSKFGVFSQGLLMPLSEFPEIREDVGEYEDVTELLGVKYSVEEDNKRKAGKVDPNAKYTSMKARHPKFFKNPTVKKLMKYKWFRKFIYVFLGKKKDNPQRFPDGKFEGVKRTDQERVECMPWILKDKTPFVVTQKCDGSSGTYILERKGRRKYEFYVCSRNVRMLRPDQECFYKDKNYYWEAAIKYDIENKMKQWLTDHPTATFVCWQGEVCSTNIQSNPHKLTETHLYCFHWTDSINGRRDIREAAAEWKEIGMEVVPIVDDNFIMPDTIEEFKAMADGYYDPSVCEGKENCKREGFVYYKTTDPTFSFKNVSREYLLKH